MFIGYTFVEVFNVYPIPDPMNFYVPLRREAWDAHKSSVVYMVMYRGSTWTTSRTTSAATTTFSATCRCSQAGVRQLHGVHDTAYRAAQRALPP